MHSTLNKAGLVCAILGLFTFLPVQAQDIQKCTQEDGSVMYQQTPCPAGTSSKTMAMASGEPDRLTLNANSYHQYSTTLTINGITVTGQIDTGATFVTLSMETATRMHISPTDLQRKNLMTANGVIGTANKMISVLKVGKFELYNVEVAITPNSPTLIGMSALSQMKFANENGNLVLSKR